MPEKNHRERALAKIQSNIELHRLHIYLIVGGCLPRHAYTIGLTQDDLPELVFAGGSLYNGVEVEHLLNELAKYVRSDRIDRLDQQVYVDRLGKFSFRRIDVSWSSELMIGAFDYYRDSGKLVTAFQVVPEAKSLTSDVPDMSKPWSAEAEPVWAWIHEEWRFDVPRESTVTTNLGALRNQRVTEAVRWENDYWEAFAGPMPDIVESDLRIVPFGTMLALDRSLERLVSLEVGEGLWRDDGSGVWHKWEKGEH